MKEAHHQYGAGVQYRSSHIISTDEVCTMGLPKLLRGLLVVVLIWENILQTILKSVQSTLSHLITTSVPRAMFTHFLVEHGLSQYYLY